VRRLLKRAASARAMLVASYDELLNRIAEKRRQLAVAA
jgi:hypothetical protein